MIHELRVYHCLPGRLPALLDRFEQITLPMWKQFRITPVGFWTTLVGDSNHALQYLLQWNSMAEREERWNAFQADPDWIAKRAETERERPIVARISNEFWMPTRFSPVR